MSPAGPYKIGTISRLTGFSAVLLRAWESRYGILKPSRGPGGHRLYSEDDLRVLRRVQEWVKGGRSIGEIAALGRAAILASLDDPGAGVVEGEPAGAQQDALDGLKSAVVQGALRLDSEAVNRALDEAAATVSPTMLIERVIEPAAREIGELWQAGECTVASEHLVSEIFVSRLRRLLDLVQPGRNESDRLAIAACMPGEDHQLGLQILAYFLSRRGVRVLYLGSNLPFEELRRACEATRPDALLLSVSRRPIFKRQQAGLVRLLREVNHETRFYLGGRGTPEEHPELEEAGLQLASSHQSVREVAREIAETLAVGEEQGTGQ